MFPISDETPRHSFPFINYFIILANIFVFYIQLSSPDIEKFIFSYGFVPSQFHVLEVDSYFPILSSMFMHGGILHILSNMWFLHIFGDNIEDRLGHFAYLGFYLVGGVAALFTQYFLMSSSQVPVIGASGAVSAIAGAYYVFFRHSHVKTLITFFVITIVRLPASFVLGYWFLSQVFAGLGSFASFDVNQGGIAFFAHIGGFVFGYVISKYIT